MKFLGILESEMIKVSDYTSLMVAMVTDNGCKNRENDIWPKF